MAKNTIPEQLDRLFAFAEDAIEGLTSIGAATGVAQNTAPVLQAVLNSARGAEAAFQTARSQKVATTAAVAAVDKDAKAFISTAKGVLQNYLGRQWTTAWSQAGFVSNSLATPTTTDERLSLLATLRDHFAATPAHENAPLNVTAARAGQLHTSLSAARTAANAALQTLSATRQEREPAVAGLRLRLRGLINELGLLLSNTDSRWRTFGLRAPADETTPGAPEAPRLNPGAPGSGMLVLNWPGARLATRYRVWVKKAGEDDFLPLATVNENETVLHNLPISKPLTVRLTAANDAGESAPGPSASVTLT